MHPNADPSPGAVGPKDRASLLSESHLFCIYLAYPRFRSLLSEGGGSSCGRLWCSSCRVFVCVTCFSSSSFIPSDSGWYDLGASAAELLAWGRGANRHSISGIAIAFLGPYCTDP